MNGQPALLVLTGASGAGKTTLVHALQAMRLPGVGCYFFDEIGVPSAEEMTRRFGGGEQWQSAMTAGWITRLLRNDDGVRVAVLDGQVRPSMARGHLQRLGAQRWQIALADCGHAERNARLHGPRAQPELATGDMDCWAAYLRGQADALGLPVIDTSRPLAETVAELAALAESLANGE
ncbi:MAG TPA: hypothetical protein VF541_08050 [Longimicrobium sp.]|jgi:hypothetical protein